MISLSKQVIEKYAAKYNQEETPGNKLIEEEMKQKLAEQDSLSREDFIRIARWKSPRPTRLYESNSQELVREVSDVAFHASNEELKIRVLTLLSGCSYPVASVILHFKYPNRYPILDFRALWSLRGINPPNQYNYEFWQEYVDEVRAKAEEFDIDIRTLDKVLWQYSADNQKA